MPITSRPDLLPLALPKRIGLPYHGRVQSGSLTCADSTTLTYPQPSTTDDDNEARAILVRGRSPNTATLVDPNAKRRWQNYALLSGKNRSIGGQELTSQTWLYADPDGYTWRVRYALTKDGANFELKVYLVEPFGIFADADHTMTERLLGTHAFQSVHPYNAAVVSWNRASTTQSSHSQYGDISMVWVDHNTSGAAPGYAVYHDPGADAVKITLAGSGALTGTIGSGITATFLHYGNARELLPTNILAEYDGTQKQWVAIRPNGSVVEVTYYAESAMTDCDYQVIDGKTWCFRDGFGFIAVEFTGGVYTWRNDFSWSEKFEVGNPPTYEITDGCKPETVGVYQLDSNVDVFQFQWAYCLGDPLTYTLIHTDKGQLAESASLTTTPVAVDPGTGAYTAGADSCYV